MSNRKWISVTMLCLVYGFVSAQVSDAVPAKSSLLKRTSITPIPIISYNRSYGTSVGIMVNAFTIINKKDTISPPSMTGVALASRKISHGLVLDFNGYF